MSRIRSVLRESARSSDIEITVALVNRWISELRSIPYGFSQSWKTPSEVETSPIADCKGKSVALYEKMQSHGATKVRLVIGKRSSSSRSTHAWLEWATNNGTYVLDPTINWMARRIDRISEKTYLPFYAYAGSRKYRAVPAKLVAQN